MAKNRQAVANLQFLKGVFTVPEHEKATLYQLEEKLSENLNEFLTQSKVSGEIPLDELAKKFSKTEIPETPAFVTDHVNYLLDNIIPYCVNTGSPKFIGHMTSALPYFQLSLSKCMVALHQNVVKIETSRAFTLLEKQTIGMLHRLIYKRDDQFYAKNTQKREPTLGIQTSGGTVANITALWVARNLFIEKSLGSASKEGSFIEALISSSYKNACVFVSQRGHYSLKKAADILGIGTKNLIQVPVGPDHKIQLDQLKEKISEARANNLYPLAVVGIAGTTETGHVDPLDAMADLCEKEGIFFHVDAAWGGPVLFSDKHRQVLKGIERADSVTIDGHKQLYLPMGVGQLLFKDPNAARTIEQQANYIIRAGSFDLGRRSLEGSRPGMAFLAYSALHIFGAKGYELLIDRNIELANSFAKLIEAHDHFELISTPELNLITYRYNPLKESCSELSNELNHELNSLNIRLQKNQREQGQSFVSRTRFRHPEPKGFPIEVLRSVLANPHTEVSDLEKILAEQCMIGEGILKKHVKELPLLKKTLS